jgi:hypothetical protein
LLTLELTLELHSTGRTSARARRNADIIALHYAGLLHTGNRVPRRIADSHAPELTIDFAFI